MFSKHVQLLPETKTKTIIYFAHPKDAEKTFMQKRIPVILFLLVLKISCFLNSSDKNNVKLGLKY